MSKNITFTLDIENKDFVQALNQIRKSHDPGFEKWLLPHIKLLGPIDITHDKLFSDEFSQQIDKLVGNDKPIEVIFESISFFKLGMTYYIYLKPDANSESLIINKHNQLKSMFPEYQNEHFKPYLIIGHSYHPFLQQNLTNFNVLLKDFLNKKFTINFINGMTPAKFNDKTMDTEFVYYLQKNMC
jgi:hypothetical protein